MQAQTQKSDVVFLLFEGLPPTIIESQVLAHARDMRQMGINMEVWSFAVTSSAYKQGRTALPRLLDEYGIPIRLFRGTKPALPLSHQINALLLLYQLLVTNTKPRFVHARTEYSAAVAATIKKLARFRLIWDARGDTLSEFEEKATKFKPPYRWFSWTKRKAIRARLNLVARTCDYGIFVSEALQQLQGSLLSESKKMVVPCLADEKLFYYDPELQTKMRAMLGYDEDHIVMVYSGSIAPWQCVHQTISLMRQAMESDVRVRALIVSSQPDTFERLIPSEIRQRVVITSCSLREMNGFLNAADIGLMLRMKSPINWVASPVKYAEYSLTGLRVVTTDAIHQVIVFGQDIGNIMDRSDISRVVREGPESEAARRTRADAAIRVLGRSAFRNKLVAVYGTTAGDMQKT